MKKFFLLTLLLVVSSIAYGAAVVGPMPPITTRFMNATGTAALTGGYVVTCPAGVTCSCTSYTPKLTYTDYTGLVVNADPTYLNARGEADIWLDTQAGAYKVTVCDRFGVLQKSVDGVTAISQVTSASSSISEWVTSGNLPTYISTTQFSVSSNSTATFYPGRRLKIVETAGTIYATVASSSYSGGITTVTVVPDSINLDSGMSAVYIGILNAANISSPIYPVSRITGTYNITFSDFGKVLEVNNSSLVSNIVLNLPLAATVPSGFWFQVSSVGTGTIGYPYFNLNISGVATGYLYPGDSIRVFSSGSDWYGNRISTVAANPYTIPLTNSTNKLDYNFIPGYISGIMTGATSTTGSSNVTTGATYTIASFPSITVTAGDIIYYSVYSFSSRASDTTVDVTPERYGLIRDPNSTAVIGFNLTAGLGSSVYSSITPSGRTIMPSTLSSVATVSTSGSLITDMMFICGAGTAGNDCTASMTGYYIFWKKQ